MNTKISIRPELNEIANKENITPIEYFQNATLRPIIKLQHTLLITFYKDYLISRKTDFNNTSNDQAFIFIKNSLLKDSRLKNKVLGLILGMFTVDELTTYLTDSSEINKRILGIVKQRLTDSILELR